MGNHIGSFGQVTPDTGSIRDEEMLDGAAIHDVSHVSGYVYVECTYLFDDADFAYMHTLSKRLRMTVRGRSDDHFLAAVRAEFDRRSDGEDDIAGAEVAAWRRMGLTRY